MDAKRFDEILHETVSSTVETLASKAKEYAKGDRLYNFKRAALILDTTPEKALAGMIAKHLVSVLDLIEGTLPATSAMLNEKIGDTINYLILLKALLLEKAANGFIKREPSLDALNALNKLDKDVAETYKKYIERAEQEQPKAAPKSMYDKMLNYMEEIDKAEAKASKPGSIMFVTEPAPISKEAYDAIPVKLANLATKPQGFVACDPKTLSPLYEE